MLFLRLASFFFIRYNLLWETLISLCLFMVIFSCTSGTAFFVYVSEISQAAGTGLAVFTLMAMMILQSLFSDDLIELPKFGI